MRMQVSRKVIASTPAPGQFWSGRSQLAMKYLRPRSTFDVKLGNGYKDGNQQLHKCNLSNMCAYIYFNMYPHVNVRARRHIASLSV